MKIGIFADIHGNIYAFENVWKELRKESCDRYFFLGDICGYYYYQNEIISLLKEIKNLMCVIGNHDDMFLKILSGDDSLARAYRQKYGKAQDILKENIKPDNLFFLQDLPEKMIIDEYKIGIFHGSPWDYLNGYVYPTDHFDCFKESPFNIVLLGHTHYPMYKKIANLHIINPGSCGQPRDYNKPSFAVFDLETEKVEFKRVEYDMVRILKDIKKHEEEESYLFDVLHRN